jgi:hypothetical protein
MIDTLNLNAVEREILPVRHLELDTGTTNLGTGESTGNHRLGGSGKHEIIGAKAFYNAPDGSFAVTVKPAKSDPTNILCIVTFSAPRVALGSNYTLADAETLKTALKRVESELLAVGIKTNLNAARVIRLDATKNVLSDEPFSSYYPIIDQIPKRLREKTKYGSSFLFRNTRQQISIYDKLAEMQYHDLDISKLSQTIRFEQRWTKSEKVKTILGGMTTIGEISKNLDIVEQQYKLSMKKHIFRMDSFKPDLGTALQVEKELMFFFERGDRYWFENWQKAFGYRFYPSQEAVIEAVNNMPINRTSIYKIKQKLYKTQMEAMALEPVIRGRKTSGQLYEELKKKVLS